MTPKEAEEILEDICCDLQEGAKLGPKMQAKIDECNRVIVSI